jgi:tetratricopeptide (TPR) repeat protein
MRSYNNLPATITELASDFPRAEAVLREGIELAQRGGSPPHEGWLTGSLGDVLFKLGELEEAERLQRRSLELAGIVGDEPLLGMRLSSLAFAIVIRGGIDEAERFQRESIPVLNANPEPQSQVFIPLVEGYLALARGDDAETITQFQATVEQLRAGSVETAPDVFTELVRTLIRSGRAAEAEAYRDLAERGRSPEARANATLIDGLLSPDPAEARRFLTEGAAELEGLGMRIDAARAMVDLARAKARVGEDGRPTLERARALLLECDAKLFLVEVDEALAEVVA